MKVKALVREPESYGPARRGDGAPMPRNANAALHPMERAREYTRAMNATKLNRMFAQPFVGQMGHGHVDGVYSLARDDRTLTRAASGSGDGVVKCWDVAEREETWSVSAHTGIVRDMCFTREGQLLTCASDRLIRLWDCSSNEPVQTFHGDSALNSIDHHREESLFASASDKIHVWDVERASPVTTFAWGVDNIASVRFNRSETNVLASVGGDRGVTLYDLRTGSPLSKLVMRMRSNCLCFNPVEPFNFATGSEDHNVYAFDMRNMKRALNVYKDHVGAVMDLDFSPTGQELVSGSYDRSIRIFKLNSGHSRDVYHTKRMQRVFSVRFTMDSRYVLSGSDDGNVRVWRANASERSNVKSTRERVKLEYMDSLRERYKHMPEIRRIDRHRHMPKIIKKAASIKKIEEQSIKRKEDNRRKHSKPGAVPHVSEREKHVVSIQK